jgi:predicted transcriptional regulator
MSNAWIDAINEKQLWAVICEAESALVDRYQSAVELYVRSSGAGNRQWGILLAALTFEPEEITPAHLMVRGPYTNAEEYLTRLRKCSDNGFLQEVEPGEFRLTEKGREFIQQYINLARQAMVEADPLIPEDSNRLAELFSRLVENSLTNKPPPKTWSIALSFKLLPEKIPPMPFIEQSISCLYAYRDDCHLAAWQHTGLTATSMDVLTLIWKKETKSISDLMLKLSQRGHSEDVYSNAVVGLRQLGFISGTRNSLRLSTTGQVFRDQIEQETDRYFYRPWTCLNRVEIEEMSNLSTRLLDGLKTGT